MFKSILWLIFIVILIAYVYLRRVYSYWQRLGVETPLAPSFPFGNFGKSFLQKCTLGELMQEFFYSSAKPFIGVYAGVRPMLVLRDTQLIQRVLVTDFQHFQDRGWYSNEKADPLSSHLLLASGEKWKRMRAKLTPTFTSGKLRAMMPAFVERGEQLRGYLGKFAGSSVAVEMCDICSRYSINNIAATAFGIDINCFDNPDEEFMKHGHQFFALKLTNILRQLGMFISPGLMRLFNVRLADKEVADFMIAMVKQNLKHREEQQVVRQDFFQLLVQIRNGNAVSQDRGWDATITSSEQHKELTINEVAAQAYMFLVAGYETSASAMSFCLYELAGHPDVQARLHSEIDRVMAAQGGELTYESLLEMKYLDCCVDETLRKYPPLTALNRECTIDYQIPGTELVIAKGTPIAVPVWALHYDDQFYPSPQQFQPERFAIENRKSFVDQPWLPFGDGPRACIGTRMGRMQTKIGLIAMLRHLRFELSDKLLRDGLHISRKNMVPTPVNGIHLLVSNRF